MTLSLEIVLLVLQAKVQHRHEKQTLRLIKPIQVTKHLKRFLSMYPQMSESSSHPVRAPTPLQLLIHKEIG